MGESKRCGDFPGTTAGCQHSSLRASGHVLVTLHVWVGMAAFGLAVAAEGGREWMGLEGSDWERGKGERREGTRVTHTAVGMKPYPP